jgi:hypothetical protein
MYQMVIKYPKDPPKFTQIGILGSKTNHLATLFGLAEASRVEEMPGSLNHFSVFQDTLRSSAQRKFSPLFNIAACDFKQEILVRFLTAEN